MVENIVEDNGTSLNDFGGDVTVFSLGSALDEGAIVIIQRAHMSFLHFWEYWGVFILFHLLAAFVALVPSSLA